MPIRRDSTSKVARMRVSLVDTSDARPSIIQVVKGPSNRVNEKCRKVDGEFKNECPEIITAYFKINKAYFTREKEHVGIKSTSPQRIKTPSEGNPKWENVKFTLIWNNRLDLE